MKSSVPVACLLLGAFTATATGQTVRWEHAFGSELAGGLANAVTCGRDRSAYAAGTSWHMDSLSLLMTVVSLDSAGDRRWLYQRRGWVGQPSLIPVDHPLVYGLDGNLYLAGSVCGPGYPPVYEFGVVSLTDMGDERWAYRYRDAADSSGLAHAVVQAEDGGIYAAGYCTERSDFTVVALDTSGSERWVVRYPGLATSLVADAEGSIYCTGSIRGSFAVVKLTPAGVMSWAYRHDTLGNTTGMAQAVTLMEDGSILAAGELPGGEAGSDFAAICLTPDGDVQWVYRYGGIENAVDRACALARGPDRSILVAGTSTNAEARTDITVVCLSRAGSELWTYHYDIRLDSEFRVSLATGDDGNIYVGGLSRGQTGFGLFTVIGLSHTGAERWVYRHHYENSGSFCAALVYGTDKSIYAVGQTRGNAFTVVCLDPVIGVAESPALPVETRVWSTTIVRGSLVLRPVSCPDHTQSALCLCGSKSSPVLLDISGRKVMELQPGENDVRLLAPGVYFIREHSAGDRRHSGPGLRVVITR